MAELRSDKPTFFTFLVPSGATLLENYVQLNEISTWPKAPKLAFIWLPEVHSMGRIKLPERTVWLGSIFCAYWAIRRASHSTPLTGSLRTPVPRPIYSTSPPQNTIAPAQRRSWDDTLSFSRAKTMPTLAAFSLIVSETLCVIQLWVSCIGLRASTISSEGHTNLLPQ